MTSFLKRSPRLAFSLFLVVACALGLAGIILTSPAAPTAQAQTCAAEVGTTSTGTGTSGKNVRTFTVTATNDATLSEFYIDLSRSPNIGVNSPYAFTTISVDGTIVSRSSTDRQSGESMLDISRDSSGRITMTPDTPITVSAGQTIKLAVSFKSAINPAGATVSVNGEGTNCPNVDPTTTQPTPTTTAPVTPTRPGEVTPVAPTLNKSQCDVEKTVSLPKVNGVKYVQVKNLYNVTVTATPMTGFSFPQGATTEWSFDVTPEPCDPSAPKFTVTPFNGIKIDNQGTSDSSPFVTKVKVPEASKFQRAVVKINSPLPITLKNGALAFDKITPGYGIAHTQPKLSAGGKYAEIEFYLTKNGRRVDFASIPADTLLTFTTDIAKTAGVKVDIEIYGEPEPAAPVPTAEYPQCTSDSPFKDAKGDTAPRPSGTSNVRKSARELTPEERARGASVYVTAAHDGDPNSVPHQGRRYSTLYLQERVSGEFTKIGDMKGWIVNALAYNKNDNYLYAISQGRVGVDKNGQDTYARTKRPGDNENVSESLFYEDPCYPAGHLLQIDPVTAEVVDLGKVTKANGSTVKDNTGYGFQGVSGYGWPNDLWGGLNVGFFDANGDYWVSNASYSGTGALYKVDLQKVNADTDYSFNPDPLYDRRYGNDRTLNVYSQPYGYNERKKWRTYSEDYAIIQDLATGTPTQGNYAWGIVNAWNSGDKVLIERINMATGVSEIFDISNLTTITGQKIPTGHQWSKAWVYPDGTLGFGTGSSEANSDVVRIKVENATAGSPTFTLQSVFTGAPVAYNTNGTSNGSARFEADLETTKRLEKIENGRIYWRIDAWNNGPDGLSGFSLEDTATKDFTDMRIERVEKNLRPDGSEIPHVATVGNNSIQIEFGSLPARASGDTNPQVSVLISAALTGTDKEKCVANTVRAVNDENDPKVENNTFTTSCDIEIEKTPVDSNNDRNIDEKDVQGPNTDGIYTVTYDVTVTNKSTTVENTYTQVEDIVAFPNPPFAVQSVSVQRPGADGKPAGAAVRLDPTETNGTTYVLGGPKKLGKGASDTYRVTVAFKANLSELTTNPALGKCSVEKTGLYNVAQVGAEKDDACVPFPTPDKLPLKIVKLEANGTEKPIPGAEFALYKADADGNLVQSDDARVEVKNDSTGNFTAQIDAPGVYWLIETKAPAGLSLLPEPVKFAASWNEKNGVKTPVIEVKQGGSSLIKSGTESGNGTAGSPTFAVLKVADVRNGELPKTGGLGIWLFPLLGLLICLIAVFWARRSKN